MKEDFFFLYALVFAFCGLASKSSKYNHGHRSLIRSLTLLPLLLLKTVPRTLRFSDSLVQSYPVELSYYSCLKKEFALSLSNIELTVFSDVS